MRFFSLEHGPDLVLGEHVDLAANRALVLRLLARHVDVALLAALGAANGVWRHVVWVGLEGAAAKAAVEDLDKVEHEPRADLDEFDGLFTLLEHRADLSSVLSAINDLKVAKPDLAIEDAEGHHVVHERLALRVAGRGAEDVCEQLLEKLERRLGLELLGEGEHWTRSLEAVAAQAKLVHGVDVEDVELGRRPVWGLAQPHVQVLALARLEEDAVVAVLHVAEPVDLVQVALGVVLDLLAVVRQQGADVLHEVPEARGDAARAEHERTLFVAVWHDAGDRLLLGQPLLHDLRVTLRQGALDALLRGSGSTLILAVSFVAAAACRREASV
mmetsp:Transcript_24404/g.77912  ORF Transcript_24404/g.77912 Transcript_24404/m.77912 type:complete len:329 (-) Transcript_24404:308-1294(-)